MDSKRSICSGATSRFYVSLPGSGRGNEPHDCRSSIEQHDGPTPKFDVGDGCKASRKNLPSHIDKKFECQIDMTTSERHENMVSA